MKIKYAVRSYEDFFEKSCVFFDTLGEALVFADKTGPFVDVVTVKKEFFEDIIYFEEKKEK